MPNDPYLDASVAWRIKTGNIEFREADYRTTKQNIESAGLATEVLGLISAGKEADVYLARYHSGLIAIKVYRLYRTSHRGGGPIKMASTGLMAAHEYEMQLQAWKGGVRVPTPARRVENMLSMRYLGDVNGAAPRLQDVDLDEPEKFLYHIIEGIRTMARAGVVHTDLSAFNILVYKGEPWFIDFSEAMRVDRTGYCAWERLSQARDALCLGMKALQMYFRKNDIEVYQDEYVSEIISELDRHHVLR